MVVNDNHTIAPEGIELVSNVETLVAVELEVTSEGESIKAVPAAEISVPNFIEGTTDGLEPPTITYTIVSTAIPVEIPIGIFRVVIISEESVPPPFCIRIVHFLN
jgi:hypothetical protein